MPELGDKRRQRDLGYKGKGYIWYIWHACEGCGKERWVRYHLGKPERTVCRSCSQRHGHYRTTPRRRENQGYIIIGIEPSDFFYSMARKDGTVFEHRLVMAKHLSRCLLPWEVVHHRNGIKNDNRPENLELLGGNNKHNKLLNKEIKRLKRRVLELENELALTR